MAYKVKRRKRRSSKPMTLGTFVSRVKRRRPMVIIFKRAPSAEEKKALAVLGYRHRRSIGRHDAKWAFVLRRPKRHTSKAPKRRHSSKRRSSRRRTSRR